ncbi:hypothetical protein GT037_001080 [Alternaria burnsii]|uniref:Uncharacterized protein n=1 Tax=Alternaria burnsii TaxID=1187904 RepID=A0A8H7EKE4_9PLEO|nr:uncharacterized protein GT037_001080 [Alternaria burnsii]KAF7682104.1 hypothetical protein GT037_001080 [Alternaria burnsii]CAI9636052.1 unnamed protein product [Alternaria burnsii]
MTVTASIDIASPPETVRAKFLDFASLSKYHKGFFTSLSPLGPVESGNKIRVVFSSGQQMDAPIEHNTLKSFAWTGSIPLLFTGTHSFAFEPSSTIPGGTKFTQEEVFSGALAFLMGENVVARHFGFPEKTRRGWEGYNNDLKAWCEAQ